MKWKDLRRNIGRIFSNFKQKLQKHIKLIALITSTIIGLSLVISALFMLGNYMDEIEERAVSKAQYNTVLLRENIQDNLNELVTKASNVASNLHNYNDNNSLKEYFDKIKNEEGIYDGKKNPTYDIAIIRFYKDGKLYDMYTDEITVNDDPALDEYTANETQACYAGSYFDEDRNMTMISFYSPVEDCDLVDGIELIYTRERLRLYFTEEYKSEDAEFSLMITEEGVIIVGDDSTSSIIPTGESVQMGDIKEILRKMVGYKAPIDKVDSILKSHKDGTIKVDIGIQSYIISIGSHDTKLKDLYVFEIYSVQKLCQSGYAFIYSIIAIIIMFAIVALAVIIYLFVHNRQIKVKLFDLSTVNPILNCLNRNGFEAEATKYLERNITSSFVIIVCEIKHFDFDTQKHGESEMENALKYTRNAITKFCHEEETFGYFEAGQFLLLLHTSKREELIARLKTLSYILTKYKSPTGLELEIKNGIYEVEKDDSTSVNKMIDYAKEANDAAKKATVENALMQFNFYDANIRKTRAINEDMESRMESALKNGEFQVFFQPKYNLITNKQDGAEALVRWYDQKTNVYNPPALFMALFEANGFITQLDRYVFERVCEHIQYQIAHGRKVYPVSVNVSRITAVQDGFVETYSQIKRRYGISDKVITIEFTESFAYENYDILHKIVDGLHKSGFICSIDDFGCGYSSYLILKSLPMDEIKLDRIFMENGVNDERDNIIYQSVVKLGKDLHMKVTQEGVETKERLEYIRQMGCDVVQGYIYSKPLPRSDYIKFTQTSNEIKL